MTSQRIAAQTAPEFAAFCADFFETMDPAQRVNRKFVTQVILERAERCQDPDVAFAAFDWLDERCVRDDI